MDQAVLCTGHVCLFCLFCLFVFWLLGCLFACTYVQACIKGYGMVWLFKQMWKSCMWHTTYSALPLVKQGTLGPFLAQRLLSAWTSNVSSKSLEKSATNCKSGVRSSQPKGFRRLTLDGGLGLCCTANRSHPAELRHENSQCKCARMRILMGLGCGVPCLQPLGLAGLKAECMRIIRLMAGVPRSNEVSVRFRSR